MPDGGEILATRVAFLELKDERRLIQEGYELLDEKRVLLATEIMRQLRHYASLQADLTQLGADVGYTLDGSSPGEIDFETFSADAAVLAREAIPAPVVNAFLTEFAE